MKRLADGRGLVKVNATTAGMLAGNDDLSTWTDEELLRGQKRDRRGKWSGKPPAVVPMQVHKELIRRRVMECESIIRESCVEAAKYLDSVVRGTDLPNGARIKAADIMLDRFLGKPKESVDIKVAVEEPAWVQAQRVVYEWDESDVIDATPVPSQAAQIRQQQQTGVTPEHSDIIAAEVVETEPADDAPAPATEPEPDDDEWDDVVDSTAGLTDRTAAALDPDAVEPLDDDWTFPPDDDG